ARQQAEAVDAAVLLGALDRELEAEADAEHGLRGRDPRTQRLVEALLAQLVHGRAGGADAGQHREVGARDVVGHLRAEPTQRDLDRADVPGAVIADRDLHSTPFVDGMPADSARSATRSARPTALYDASTTWCGSRPPAWTWIAIRPACASEPKKCVAIPGSGVIPISPPGRPPTPTPPRPTPPPIPP